MPFTSINAGATAAGSIVKAYRSSIFNFSGKTYAVVTKNQASQGSGGFVVVDVSDPDNPTIVNETTDSTSSSNDNAATDWELLNGAFDVATAVVGGVPYAVISQNTGSASSPGGITIVKLTDSSGDITATSPSVVQQIQEGNTSLSSSLSAKLKNLKGIALQELNGQTYLFTAGNRDSDDQGFLQVYDFDNLIDGDTTNDSSALFNEFEDSNVDPITDTWEVKTFTKDNKIYAIVTSQEVKSGRTSQEYFEFNPSGNTLNGATGYYNWTGRVTSGIATATIGTDNYVAVVSTDDDPDHTASQPALVVYNTTNFNGTALSSISLLDAELPDDSTTYLEGVNQIAFTEAGGRYFVAAPNSKSGSNRVEFFEFDPTGTGAYGTGDFSYSSTITDNGQDVTGSTF